MDNQNQNQKKGKRTLMEIFNSHVDAEFGIESYAHPGRHVLTKKAAAAIADDVAAAIKAGEMESKDLRLTIGYEPWIPGAKGSGNRKLRGSAYFASHPLIDCYLDGLDRKVPACDGLNGWCYAFSYFYRMFGKQLSMLANSIIAILEPDRMERELMSWIDYMAPYMTRNPQNGHVPFRISEAGDITYSLPVWLRVAERCAESHPEIRFYAYTKQFALLDGLGYVIDEAFPNFRVLRSDSVEGDPNPIGRAPDAYGIFAILFKDAKKTPERVISFVRSRVAKKDLSHVCPGPKAGCFGCSKCSEPKTEATAMIVAAEH